jgi:hypothetical protein
MHGRINCWRAIVLEMGAVTGCGKVADAGELVGGISKQLQACPTIH